jgi:Flp pilus assembly protein TadG
VRRRVLSKMLGRSGGRSRKKSRGQSIVEFVVLLPILLMMLSGLIEFGFMLNYYLDLIDAAREAARFAAGDDPLHDDDSGNFIDPNCQFYLRAQQVAQQSLNLGSGGQITLNPATDDVIISVYSALEDGTVDARWPQNTTGCGSMHIHVGEVSLNDTHTSGLDTTTDIEDKLNSPAPNTGLVSVEIYYDYHMILGLPWITAFVPDTVTLWAYSIMPNPHAEPTPTPSS